MTSNRLITALCLALAAFSIAQEAAASTFLVTNTNPTGPGSLEQAILDANNSSGFPVDEIHFNIPVATDPGCDAASGVCTIQPSGPLVSVTDPLLINGFTQPGALQHVGSGSVSQGINAVLKIELDGSSAGSTANGLTFTAYGEVQGLVINRFAANGIEASAGLSLGGNFIGTDVSGSAVLPNGGHGVLVTGSGTLSENVLAGNAADGLRFSGIGLIVQNNLIGVQADGSSPLGNGGRGVTAHGQGLVGTFSTSYFPSNVIAANGQAGVAIGGASWGAVGVWSNSIYDNGALGIDVEGGVEDSFGVTAQAPASNNAPILTQAATDGVNTTVQGTVHGWPGMTVNLQFFYGDSCDPSGHGEGKGFLAATAVSLDGNGDANFSVTSTTPLPVGKVVTATASPFGPDYGATTEFSNCQQVYHWVVNTTGNAGDVNPGDGLCSDSGGNCSLRAAIEESNANPAIPNKTIAFNIPQTDPGCLPVTGVCTITAASPFAITEPVTIDGYTQPGAVENTNPIDQPINAALKIEVSFSNIGFQISSGNTTVRGLVINMNGFPFWLETNGGNVIEGNFLGTDVDGLVDPNGTGGGAGLRIKSNNNLIGGTSPAARNLISGFLNGMMLLGGADGNVIQGNFIGTNRNGTATISNQTGIQVSAASNTQIGGALPASRNLIAGSTTAAIYLSSATDSLVEGNFLGTDLTGTLPLWNTQGILVGNTATGNRLQGNIIRNTGGLGIDLLPLGVTNNDAGDLDTGANQRQNFPVIAAAGTDGASTSIIGSLSSSASTAGYTLEFFANSACDPSMHGEGEVVLGTTVVNTDASGHAGFSVVLPVATPVGHWITATATDPNGNTSEFSACTLVFLDSDSDGIADAVDSAPLTISDGFSDVSLGGTTDGSISLRGDRLWLIQDQVPNPGSGVRITVGPGPLGGQIQGTGGTCVPSSLVDVPPSAEADLVFTCASTTVQVSAGLVTLSATVGGVGATVEVGPGGGVTFRLVGGTLQIINVGSTLLNGRYDGRPFTLKPRQSIRFG